jgi:hypothetical protein
MNDYFLVKNFFNYEKLISPPKNLPKNLKTVYVTDNENNTELLQNLGWEIVKIVKDFIHLTDLFERRKVISYINSYPLKVVPELIDPRYIFICDSNIDSLWFKYQNFVDTCSDEFALFVTSGYYQNGRDNIDSECIASCNQPRWSYNHNEIRESTNKYKKTLTDAGVNTEQLSIVSAKYIGWNVKHPKYGELSDTLYSEYSVNLQGNIILTYISGLYKNFVYNYYENDYSGGVVNQHNFQA